MNCKRSLFICIVLALIFAPAYGVTVGSDTMSSRQLRTYFPASDTNNLMTGFAVFENGLTLQDASTTCTFDAFFPLSGNITLNGGTLFLARDLVLKSPFSIGAGCINGKDYALEFPRSISTIYLPTQHHSKVLSEVDSISVSDYVYSVDWSYDNNYLAVAVDGNSSLHELQVYYFDGLSLTLTASANMGLNDVNSVAWHPTDHYLAVGKKSGSDELKIFHLDSVTNAFTNSSNADVGTVNAVEWDPTGNYLAVGRDNTSSLLIYDVENGVLGSSYSGSFATSRKVLRNAIDWHSTSSYVAVGLTEKSLHDQVQVFHFTGSSVTKHGGLDLGSAVYGVSWRPNNCELAVGLYSGSDRLRIYDYDTTAGSLTEIATARVGESKSLYSIRWDPAGCYITIGKKSDSGANEVRIFYYDPTGKRLDLVGGTEVGAHVSSLAWTSDSAYVAVGDYGDMVRILQLQDELLVFKDAKLFFTTDIIITAPVIFEGDCVIHGAENIIEFVDNGSIMIGNGSTLRMEHMHLENISANKIGCYDSDGILILDNIMWQQESNYSFSLGALQFSGKVGLCGDGIFAYQSVQTSTILADTILELDADFTFSYDPLISSQHLIEFINNTSRLYLNGATLHVTVTGLQLCKGKMRIVRDSFISTETQQVSATETLDHGIILGTGNNSADDMVCEVLSGATLFVDQGAIHYKNMVSTSWHMVSDTSALSIKDGSRFYLYESLDLEDGRISFYDTTTLARVANKKIVGTVYSLGNLIFKDIAG